MIEEQQWVKAIRMIVLHQIPSSGKFGRHASSTKSLWKFAGLENEIFSFDVQKSRTILHLNSYCGKRILCLLSQQVSAQFSTVPIYRIPSCII